MAVVLIHKGGRRGEFSNYRPVSLTSFIVKVMAWLLQDEIARYITDNNMLLAAQYGFVRNISYFTSLLYFLDEITPRLDRDGRVEVCYRDFRKAFDSVKYRQ